MRIPQLYSIKEIEKKFHTGEEPVMVLCSDMNSYICKYMRTSLPAFKLVCEIMGSYFAKSWNLHTPSVAIVKIPNSHWKNMNISHVQNSPAIGSKFMNGVVDLNPATTLELNRSEDLLEQLLKIALFDFWIANEDRNSNNYNLMYEVDSEKIVSIDYGCIFNTATFDYSLTQLTTTDTILYSELFNHLAEGSSSISLKNSVENLRVWYDNNIRQSESMINILKIIPAEWNVSNLNIENKLFELFNKKWIEGVWNNFIENLFINLKKQII